MIKSRYILHYEQNISRILDFVVPFHENKIGTQELGVKILSEEEFLKIIK